MTLYLDDGDIRLYHGHVLDELRAMPSASVDCVVTSPPYYGLRDYGTGRWEGGDETCDHKAPASGGPNPERYTAGGGEMWRNANDKLYRDACGKCGARRVDGQIGLEATPALFLGTLANVFRECRRVLADHGTCWVNLGDSYVAANGYRNTVPAEGSARAFASQREWDPTKRDRSGVPAKNLLGMPWRLAFALQDDGWILRRDIIWAKPNPMPESVTDRCTSSHEYVFMLVKKPRYWYDADAVREAATYYGPNGGPASMNRNGNARPGEMKGRAGVKPEVIPGRNLRSVWEISTQPTPEAHFATYPEELVRRCILAGCPLEVCRECGKPRERLVENERRYIISEGGSHADGTYRVRYADGEHSVNFENRRGDGDGFSMNKQRWHNVPHTLGWSDCGHDAYRRGVVLDPFIGSGTTAKVARDHARHAIGIDLNAEYLEIAKKRLQQLSLLGGIA